MRLEVFRHRPGKKSWSYRDLDRHQRKIAEYVRQGAEGVLILSELKPVITLGRRAQKNPREGGLVLSEYEYQSLGIDLVEADRGGLATWHGPGQWVLFPVESLEKLTGDSRGVKDAVCLLLGAAQDTIRALGVESEIREGSQMGVWGKKGKLASVGVHVEQGVLLHGVALNVFATDVSFQGLRPCGLDEPVSYLDWEWESPMPPGVRESVFISVGQAFARALARKLEGVIEVSKLDAHGIWS